MPSGSVTLGANSITSLRYQKYGWPSNETNGNHHICEASEVRELRTCPGVRWWIVHQAVRHIPAGCQRERRYGDEREMTI
jgi:hypothetical protein